MESVDFLVKKYKKMGTGQVISQMGRVKGNAKLACLEVLKSRNKDVSQWEEDGLVETFANKQEKVETKSSAKRTVFEAEPESELTKEEKKAIENYEKERDEDPVVARIREEKEFRRNNPIEKTEKVEKTKSTKTKKQKTQFDAGEIFVIGDVANTKTKSGSEISGLISRIDKDKEGKFWLQINLGDKNIWRPEMKCWK